MATKVILILLNAGDVERKFNFHTRVRWKYRTEESIRFSILYMWQINVRYTLCYKWRNATDCTRVYPVGLNGKEKKLSRKSFGKPEGTK